MGMKLLQWLRKIPMVNDFGALNTTMLPLKGFQIMQRIQTRIVLAIQALMLSNARMFNKNSYTLRINLKRRLKANVLLRYGIPIGFIPHFREFIDFSEFNDAWTRGYFR